MFIALTNILFCIRMMKSKKYSTSRTQFVIFVTPEVIESASSGATEIERKFNN